MVKISPYIYVNLTSSSCCLFFLLFLLFTYFSKKNMNNADNKLYKHMLICNFASTVSYVIFYTTDIMAVFSEDSSVLYPVVYLFSKFSALFFNYWNVFFAVYVHYITHEYDKNFVARFQAKEKKTFKYIYIGLFLLGVIHFLEHSVINLSTGVEYHFIVMLSVVLFSCIGYSMFLIIKNFKKLIRKNLHLYSLLYQ